MPTPSRSLKKSLAYAHSPAAAAHSGLREQLRNSVIHCFEFTYELSWKMPKRYLEATEASPADLDLAFITQKPMTLGRLADTRNAFENSDLPNRVDVVDWAATSEAFRKIITQDKVVIQPAASTHTP